MCVDDLDWSSCVLCRSLGGCVWVYVGVEEGECVCESWCQGIDWGGGFFVFDMCVGMNNVMCCL